MCTCNFDKDKEKTLEFASMVSERVEDMVSAASGGNLTQEEFDDAVDTVLWKLSKVLCNAFADPIVDNMFPKVEEVSL